MIIGGGVIGLIIARELAHRDAGKIAVFERGRLGGEASYAAAGMLVPNAENETVDDFYRLCDASRQMFPNLATELLDETGIDIELDRSGTLYAAFSEEDSAHLDSRFARQTEVGIPVERLSSAETMAAEPGLSSSVRESLFFPNDWQVENRKLLLALEASVRASGVEIVETSKVDSILTSGDRVCGVKLTDGLPAYAQTIVLATGAWTSLIKIGAETMPVRVKPVRGQMISFAPPQRMFRKVIYSPRGYLVPRADGRVLIGATVENVGFDDATTAAALTELKQAAFEIAPGLDGYKVVEHWAGLRPFAEGGKPLIGRVPEYDGLFVATAHYRNGILLAPVTAGIIADAITDAARTDGPHTIGPASTLGLKAKA